MIPPASELFPIWGAGMVFALLATFLCCWVFFIERIGSSTDNELFSIWITGSIMWPITLLVLLLLLIRYVVIGWCSLFRRWKVTRIPQARVFQRHG